MVKILHAADFHMDSPFYSLPEEKAALRRREQRELLEKLAAEAENVDIVLLAGDLFDSNAGYWETCETLTRVLGSIRAQVFIAPGNHDYYTSRSPYAFMDLPGNVHVFKIPQMRSFELPDLGVRVWGAGFGSPGCESLLHGFTVPKSDMIELMVLHGDLAPASRYNAISTEDIANSGLTYLALGHVHSFSGIRKAGKTCYAYPGCLEGRGFDELGPKGFIRGEVTKDECALDFVPLATRQYRVIEADLSAADDALAAARAAVGQGSERDIARLVLKGEYSGDIDEKAILDAFSDKFFHLTLKNLTRPRRGLWDGAGDDTLTGLFLADLKSRYEESADEESRDAILLAARCGLAALEGREEWRP